jgi:hypothetical protein
MIEAETWETSPDPRAPARPSNRPQAYLVGGGIASLAAAAFLIRDGDMRGEDITILEGTDLLGGSLDAAGTATEGYTLRGGRMLESKYLCTFDLFSSIPTLDGTTTVTEEIFAWNRTMKTSSKSRLFRDGKRQTAPRFDLSERHILNLERLVLEPEVLLGRTTIAEQFDEAFFETNFWLMWSTTFAFQPWHSAVELKRYLARFVHMVTGFERLEGIMRTVYNQYDSMVRPLLKWLGERNVDFRLGTRVLDLGFGHEDGELTVERILYERDGARGEVTVHSGDRVFVTLGSMTEASSLGSTHAAPILGDKPDGGAWKLWEKIAQGRSDFGRPAVFDDHVDQSKWLSFTTTLQGEGLLEVITNLTGNVPGEGGLITFPDSAWKLSIVVPHQRSAARCLGLLGIWPRRGHGGRLRQPPDVRLQRTRDHDRGARAPRGAGEGGELAREDRLHPLHDALHHQPVPPAREGRPPRRRPRADEEPRVPGSILRAPRRRGLHGGVLGSLRADRGLRAPRSREEAAGRLPRGVQSARALPRLRIAPRSRAYGARDRATHLSSYAPSAGTKSPRVGRQDYEEELRRATIGGVSDGPSSSTRSASANRAR